MDNFLKSIKTSSLMNAVLYAGLGIVLLFWPVTSVSVLCWALGAVLLVLGAVNIIMFLIHRDGSLYFGGMLVLGIVLAAMGVWIMMSPQMVAVLVPRVIGVLICIHGANHLGVAVTLQRSGYAHWGTALLQAIVALAMGAFLVLYSFTVLSTIVRIIGLFLLYDGVTSTCIFQILKQVERDARTKANAEDVEFRED